MNKRLGFVLVACMVVPAVLFGQDKPAAQSATPANPITASEKGFYSFVSGGSRCGAEDAGRKLFLQTDTGGSHVWPARGACGGCFVHVLLASDRRSKPR